MIDSMPTAALTSGADAGRFERIGIPADPSTAALTRDEFAEWLRRFFDLDPIRASDLVLAINEAMANTAEFAYRAQALPGTMDVMSSYDPHDSTLIVTVADRGMWRPPVRQPGNRTRGRGIPLMEALSDRAEIETSADGTLVSLAFTAVNRR